MPDKIIEVKFPEVTVAKALTLALLGEVETTPKPGLVDLWDNGAHQDMDCGTFVKSTFAIVPYLVEMARLGFQWQDELPALFAAIRPLGMEAEQAMFSATAGVNTHKGAIFSLGILACAAGQDYQRYQSFAGERILMLAGEMTAPVLEAEFAAMQKRPPKTYGEKLFHQCGEKGIRGEVQQGFPAVREVALPLLRKLSAEGADIKSSRLNVLLSLMATVNDTNVLHRSNLAESVRVKEEAQRILGLGGAFSDEGWQALIDWNQEMIRKNISPGGCADLLAVTIFCWLLEQ